MKTFLMESRRLKNGIILCSYSDILVEGLEAMISKREDIVLKCIELKLENGCPITENRDL